MRYLVSASLILVGFIHLLPLSGLLGAERLVALVIGAAAYVTDTNQ